MCAIQYPGPYHFKILDPPLNQMHCNVLPKYNISLFCILLLLIRVVPSSNSLTSLATAAPYFSRSLCFLSDPTSSFGCRRPCDEYTCYIGNMSAWSNLTACPICTGKVEQKAVSNHDLYMVLLWIFSTGTSWAEYRSGLLFMVIKITLFAKCHEPRKPWKSVLFGCLNKMYLFQTPRSIFNE